MPGDVHLSGLRGGGGDGDGVTAIRVGHSRKGGSEDAIPAEHAPPQTIVVQAETCWHIAEAETLGIYLEADI